jgi:hypothetical protein
MAEIPDDASLRRLPMDRLHALVEEQFAAKRIAEERVRTLDALILESLAEFTRRCVETTNGNA